MNDSKIPRLDDLLGRATGDLVANYGTFDVGNLSVISACQESQAKLIAACHIQDGSP